MKYVHIITIILLFAFFVTPVSAGAIDDGAEMVAKGLLAYEQMKAEKLLETNYGVTLANTSDLEDMTPSQKLVYSIGAAKQNPFTIPWVMDTFTHDLIYYYIFSILIIVLCVAADIAQDKYPEKIADLNNKFTGRDGFFDYSFSFKMTILLAFAPFMAFFILDTLFTWEQLWSSGYMQNSLEYIGLSADTSVIWLFETISYALNSGLFALRIQYINEYTANILKVIILFFIPWGLFTYLAQILSAWFVSVLFMRPLVLMYSAKAVQNIAEHETTSGKLLASLGVMQLTSFLTFVTALVMVLGPLIWIAIKIFTQYLVGAGYKVMKISRELNRFRGSRHDR